jgi:putative chitobiose transport system permease protein
MKSLKAYLFLFPALLFISFFILIPVLQVIYYSFLDYNFFGESSFTGFNNYSALWNDPDFWSALINSLIFLIVTPVMMILSLLLALAVREQNRKSRFFRTVFFIPVITPVVIAGIIWRWIFAEDTGLMNYLISLFSFSPISWLTNYPVNLVSVMIVTIWRGLGYYMMLFLAGLAVIPPETEEAGLLDGASPLQQIFYIIIPMLKPVITLIFVISSASAIRIFTELYIMIPGTSASNKTLVYYMFTQAFEYFDFGTGSAAGVIVFLLTVSFSYINIRYMERL